MEKEKRYPSEAPKLLRIPLSSLSIQEETISHQKQFRLLKSVNPIDKHYSRSLFRAPLSKENKAPLLVQNEIIQKQIMQPKLIDLRPILNIQRKENVMARSLSNTVSNERTIPQLIRLPDINKVQETQLLESPKREKPKEKRQKPKDPKVFDVREDVLHVSNSRGNDSLKESRNVTVQTSPRRVPNFSPVLLSPPTFQEPRKHNRKSRQQQPIIHRKYDKREDQLFDIINELLQEKRGKRKKHKRLRLFDIIDNISVTSPNSTTEDESPIHHKQQTRRSRKLDDFTTDALVNYGLTTLPKASSYLNDNKDKSIATSKQKVSFDPIPGPDNLLSQQSEGGLNTKDPSDSWVNLINTINQNRANDYDKFEEESWRELKKITQNENKETQTLKQNVCELQQNKEVQTELKEMIEIPRTQTFFAEEIKKKEKTDEFCNRVREEVIKKLEYQEKLEDKVVQTICNAEVQTDDNEYDGGRHQQNVEKNKQPSLLPSDPSIFDRIKFTSEEHKGVSNFIHVTNTDESLQPEQTLTVVNALNKPPFTQKVPSTNPPEKNGDEFHKDFERTTEKDFNSISTKSQPSKARRPLPHNTAKSRLIDDIDDFTQGIDALENLQENIQKELKSTRMLFNTVDILQYGFGDNESRDTPLDQESVTSSEELVGMKNGSEDDFLDENEVDRSRDEIINHSPKRRSVKITSPVVSGIMEESDRWLLDDGDNEWLHYGDIETLSPRSIRRPPFAMSSLLEGENEGEKENIDLHEDEEKQKLLDEQKKDEIRKRLQIANQEEKEREIKTRQAEKREKLRRWMKERQDIERNKYLNDLEEKRGNEHNPFKSKTTFTRRQINNNITLNEETKKAALADDNRQRLDAAEALALEMINQEDKSTPNKRTRRSSINNRYKTNPGKIPLIRETRSSRMRKNALIADVIRHDRAQIRQKTSRIKPSPGKQKGQRKDKKNKEVSKLIDELSAFDQSYEFVNADDGSPRVPVHPDEFVTGQSFQRYWRHRSPDKLSMDATSWKRSFDNSINLSPRSRPTTSLKQTFNNQNVKDILTSYGLNLDNSLFQEKSETSNLLDEVDLALIQEGDTLNSTNNQSVDWNEVDRILNE